MENKETKSDMIPVKKSTSNYIPPHRRNLPSSGNWDILETPSRTTNIKFVCIPNKKVIDDDDEWLTCGKWMIFLPEGPVNDKIWKDLRSLIENGLVLMIKASTAAMKSGIVICYIRSTTETIKRTAIAIRNIIKTDIPLKYKLNCKDESEKMEEKGKTICMYTVMGKFYWRDHTGRWLLDEDARNLYIENNTCLDRQDSEEHIKKENSFKQITDNKNVSSPSGGYWCTLCDWKQRDIHGLTELDRMWKAAEELFKRRAFTKIRRPTPTCGYPSVPVKCFVPADFKTKQIFELAQELIKLTKYPCSAHYNAFITNECTAYNKYAYLHGECYECGTLLEESLDGNDLNHMRFLECIN